MHLLSKSEFYSQFLLQKIQSRKAKTNDTKRGRKKKEENDENSASASNSSSSQENLSQENSRKRRKCQNSGRLKKVKVSINDVIDEETVTANMRTIEEEDKSILREKQPNFFENGTLRSYQLDGFSWLKVMYENGVNGILADEMGLGKTIQCIALICHLIEMGVPGPFLVVAPLSTLPNWLSEFKRFSPKIPTLLYHGAENTRKEMRNLFTKKVKLEGSTQASAPVVITAYHVVVRDTKHLKKVLWRYLVVDEGHRLKNYECQLVKSFREFSTTNRLILTGTPLQNNLTELWSLLNFLLPEIFDSLDVFEAWFNITDMMEDGADDKIIQLEREKQVIGTLQKILNPFLLRRVKMDVEIDLPPKRELLVYTPMSPLQLQLYEAILKKDIKNIVGVQKLKENYRYDGNGRPIRNSKKIADYSIYFNPPRCDESRSNESCPDESRNDESCTDEYLSGEQLEKYFQRLVESKEIKPVEKAVKTAELNLKLCNIMMPCRQVVNHPYLLSYPLTPEGEYKIDDNLLKTCGKLHVLDQVLHRLKKTGHRVLLFSQMTKLLNIVEDYLTLRPHIKYKRLDGRVDLEDRTTDIDDFNRNDDFFLFLISTRAGGLGINLTSADTVIIYDSDWNPQLDLQAQDRCHRIGQTKPVLILRFVTAATIDERIIERATAKRKLEKMIIKSSRFKSPLEKKWEVALDPESLFSLLQERDHDKIHKVASGNAVFTEEELDQLLDRGDLVKEATGRKTNTQYLKGVFRVCPENIQK